MDTLAALARQRPLIALHLAAALVALLIGAVVMARPKGTFSHKTLGWIWVTLMAATSLSSFFIRDRSGPNIAGFTPIHFFTAFVAVQLPIGIRRIRQGRVAAHRKTMRGLFVGACVVAGLFTLLPGRFLGRLLWHELLGISG